MRKVAVIGVGGAGKSTLARQLGRTTGLPVIHLDQLYWGPGWLAPEPDKWRAAMQDLVVQDSWIMDGNYGATMDLRLAAADTVVFLDFPPWVTLPRVMRRWAAYRGQVRPGMADGCKERLTWEFLLWIVAYHRKRRPAVLQKLRELPRATEVVVLRSSREVAAFVEEICERQSHGAGSSQPE